MFMTSKTLHSGAIFAMSMQGKCLYTGGLDTNVNIQVEMQNFVICFWELHGNELSEVSLLC